MQHACPNSWQSHSKFVSHLGMVCSCWIKHLLYLFINPNYLNKKYAETMLLPYKMFSRCTWRYFFPNCLLIWIWKSIYGFTVRIFFSSDYPSVNWKRAQPAPLSINNKNSAGYRQPLGSNTQAHGRTDWAAKYVHLTT